MPSLREQLRSEIAFARANLGMSREEFMRQTPLEWNDAFEAWRAREGREDRRIARVCMVLAWCHGDAAATEEQFVPRLATDEEDEQTPEEMMAALDGISDRNKLKASNG